MSTAGVSSHSRPSHSTEVSVRLYAGIEGVGAAGLVFEERWVHSGSATVENTDLASHHVICGRDDTNARLTHELEFDFCLEANGAGMRQAAMLLCYTLAQFSRHRLYIGIYALRLTKEISYQPDLSSYPPCRRPSPPILRLIVSSHYRNTKEDFRLTSPSVHVQSMIPPYFFRPRDHSVGDVLEPEVTTFFGNTHHIISCFHIPPGFAPSFVNIQCFVPRRSPVGVNICGAILSHLDTSSVSASPSMLH